MGPYLAEFEKSKIVDKIHRESKAYECVLEQGDLPVRPLSGRREMDQNPLGQGVPYPNTHTYHLGNQAIFLVELC